MVFFSVFASCSQVKFTDVSKMLAASIIRQLGATTQKTTVFILVAVRN
jgi:hypothetical protein